MDILDPKDQYTLLGYALLASDKYREWLVTDPVAAAAEAGVTLTQEQAAYIKKQVSLSSLNNMATVVHGWIPQQSIRNNNWERTP